MLFLADVIKFIEKANYSTLERIQKTINQRQIKLEEDEKLKIDKINELKQKYDNDEYVCVYNPHNSTNWFIEHTPDFSDTYNFGITCGAHVKFVRKDELSSLLLK